MIKYRETFLSWISVLFIALSGTVLSCRQLNSCYEEKEIIRHAKDEAIEFMKVNYSEKKMFLEREIEISTLPLEEFSNGLKIYYGTLSEYGIPIAIFSIPQNCSFKVFSFDTEAPMFLDDPEQSLNGLKEFLIGNKTELLEQDLIRSLYYLGGYSLEEGLGVDWCSGLVNKLDEEYLPSSEDLSRVKKELNEISSVIDSVLKTESVALQMQILTEGYSDFIFLLFSAESPEKFKYIYYAPFPNVYAFRKNVKSILIYNLN